MANKELIALLNRALEMEHQAYVQYLSHAELIDGLNSEPLVARLKEIASDESKHQEKLRNIIGNFLFGVPSMGIAKTRDATEIKDTLNVNLAGEKEAVEFYNVIMEKVKEEKASLKFQYWFIEHEIRHIIIDEQDHIAELTQLLGRK